METPNPADMATQGDIGMNQSMRWKKFMEWWRDVEEKRRLYPPEVLVSMIVEKLKEIKKG